MERNGRDDIKVENGYDLEDDHGHRKKDRKEEQEEELSVERTFENQEVPSWRNQLTLRAFVSELRVEHFVQRHSNEAQSYNWYHTFPQYLCWPSGLLFYQDLDKVS